MICEYNQYKKELKNIMNDKLFNSMFNIFQNTLLPQKFLAVVIYCKNTNTCNDCPHKILPHICECTEILARFSSVLADYQIFMKNEIIISIKEDL